MSLAKKAAAGVIWNFATGMGARIFSFAGTLYVVRYISPDVYGAVNLAAATTMIMSQLLNLNFGQYLIAKRDHSEEVPFHATFLHLVLGVIMVAVLILFRAPLARLSHAEAAAYIPGLAVAMLIGRFAYVPEKMLLRELRFRNVAVGRGISEILFTLTTLAFAQRLGGFAIVAANLMRASFLTMAFAVQVPWRAWIKPHALRAATVKELVAYGVPVSIGGLAENVAYRGDNVLMGYFHGAGHAGTYIFTFNMAETPTESLADHIGDVLSPSFAKLPPDDRGRAFVRSAKLMALLVFPLSIGLASVAPTLAPTVIRDPKWVAVMPELVNMLILLSFMSIVRPISMTTTSLLQSQRRPRVLMMLGIFKAITLLVIIFALGRLNPYWVCGAALIAYAVHMLAGLFAARATDQVPVLRVLFSIGPSLVACAPMALAVIGVRTLLRSQGIHAGVFSLVIEVLTGVVVYPFSAYVFARQATKDVIGVARSMLDRRKQRDSIVNDPPAQNQ